MDESTTREKVLKKIRAALLNKNPDPYPNLSDASVYPVNDDDPVIRFSDEFTKAGGKFILCENELEFVEGLLNLAIQYHWKFVYCGEEGLSNLLTECEFPHSFETDSNPEVAVTSCECMVACNGSIVLSSRLNGLSLPVSASVHIVCAKSSQIAIEIKDAIHWLKQKYDPLPSAVSFITPRINNKTGYAETNKKQLYLFLIDDKERGYIDAAPGEDVI
jgi:L-lactate dehydrogenase complex protein LldG